VRLSTTNLIRHATLLIKPARESVYPRTTDKILFVFKTTFKRLVSKNYDAVCTISPRSSPSIHHLNTSGRKRIRSLKQLPSPRVPSLLEEASEALVE